jgi:hypothetical protein
MFFGFNLAPARFSFWRCITLQHRLREPLHDAAAIALDLFLRLYSRCDRSRAPRAGISRPLYLVAFDRPQRNRSGDLHSNGIHCLPSRLLFAPRTGNVSHDRRQRKVENAVSRCRPRERRRPNPHLRRSHSIKEPCRSAVRDRVGLVLDDNPLGIKASSCGDPEKIRTPFLSYIVQEVADHDGA